jgi:hypothetical protein
VITERGARRIRAAAACVGLVRPEPTLNRLLLILVELHDHPGLIPGQIEIPGVCSRWVPLESLLSPLVMTNYSITTSFSHSPLMRPLKSVARVRIPSGYKWESLFD